MSYAYFDHNATTAVDKAALDAMLPYFQEEYGNPSSRHALGIAARRAVDRAREQVAEAVGVQPSQVIFTSGGSEANNLFIQGAAGYMKPGQIAISAIEHPCVMKTAQELARASRGSWNLRRLAVDNQGRLDPADLDEALSHQQSGLVSVMLANNETGVIQDVTMVAEKARARGAWIHTDAVQAFGKIPVDFASLNVHALTLSSHKIYGPKGAAALIMDKRLLLKPLIYGGGHESGLRSGTEKRSRNRGIRRGLRVGQETNSGTYEAYLGITPAIGAGPDGDGWNYFWSRRFPSAQYLLFCATGYRRGYSGSASR